MVLSYYAAGNWIAALAGVLVGFFFSALVCHLALARRRPSAEHLTEFFLFVSVGGVLGGALTAFAAPLIFNNIYEYPLMMAAACLFRPRTAPRQPRLADAGAAGAVLMVLAALALMRLGAVDTVIVAGALGAAGALMAAGWGGDEERPTPLRYAFLGFAALQAVLMITIAFSIETSIIEVTRNDLTERVLAQPWSWIVLASSFILLVFIVHGTIQRRRGGTLIADLGQGVALASTLLLIGLALGAERFDARAIVAAGIAFAGMALLFNGGRPFVMAGIVLAAFVIIFLDDVRGGRVITQERSFFGVLRTRVLDDPSDPAVPQLRILMHGTTIHGAQLATPGLTRQPLTYYNQRTALGEAILAGLSTGEASSLALIGLGAGSTACLMRPDDRLTIFEIDPAVVRLSTAPEGDFTFVPECQPGARIELGDARLQIAEEPDGAFDVIVVDAFSSDAIPAHLLTREAIALYLSKTSARGIVVLHLSNRNLALVSESARVARDLHVPTLFRVSDRVSTEHAFFYGGLPASVMIVARSPEALAALPLHSRGEWRVLAPPPGRAWSDDYIALPRALWESLNGAEECYIYPYLEECAAAP
jgi:hypothetical protein